MISALKLLILGLASQAGALQKEGSISQHLAQFHIADEGENLAE